MSDLVNYLKQCDDAYYNSSNPLVNDTTYDALVETLRKIDPTNPYLKKVGAPAPSSSNKVGRLIPMGTLSKYHTDDEISDWLSSEDREYILLSPKYDGFAVELFYHNGILQYAGTRGDGYVGEDVYASVCAINSIPKTLSSYPKEDVIIRGEAIIPTKNHEAIKALGYSAMRNAVPGIVRSGRVDALQYVDFVAYEFIDGMGDRIDQRNYWKDDFIIEDYRVFFIDNLDSMKKRREELRATEYVYELDGVVLKTSTVKSDDLLSPCHMIAWKYKSNRETTILREIEFSMGATGYFTPVAIFDEVEFQGAKLTRASLGNITRMKNEFAGLTIGSYIEVSRRGDIIPFVEAMVMIDDNGELVKYPVSCPHCGEFLTMEDSEPHCENDACPETLRLKICQFARAIGVKGIGDKLVSGLIESGYLKSVSDVYDIDPAVILSIPRQGQSSVDKWKVLQDKKLSQLELLTAYPFIDLGKKIWEIVLSKYNYFELLDLSYSELSESKLKGLGDLKVSSIISQIQTHHDELVHLGLLMEI